MEGDTGGEEDMKMIKIDCDVLYEIYNGKKGKARNHRYFPYTFQNSLYWAELI